jgi:hypothetical protein
MHTLIFQPSAAKNTIAYAYLDTYRGEWRKVFIISAELYAFNWSYNNIVYLILGSHQYWSDGFPPKPIKNYSVQVVESPPPPPPPNN